MATYTVTFGTPVYVAGGGGAVGGGTLSNVVGALILGVTGEGGYGARAPPSQTAGPTYNASIAPNVNAPDIAIFPRIATAINETFGSWNWTSSSETYAYPIILKPPAGYVVPPLSALLDIPAVDDVATSVAGFRYSNPLTLAGQSNGDYLLAVSHRIRTSTTNGATIGNISPDTGFSVILQSLPSPPGNMALVANGWQQTTATNTSASDLQSLSISESSGYNNQSVLLAILAPILISSALPVPDWDERVTVPQYVFT